MLSEVYNSCNPIRSYFNSSNNFLYTWINKNDLEKIGIKPHAERAFKTITGEIIKRKVGRAEIEIDGKREFTLLFLEKRKIRRC